MIHLYIVRSVWDGLDVHYDVCHSLADAEEEVVRCKRANKHVSTKITEYEPDDSGRGIWLVRQVAGVNPGMLFRSKKYALDFKATLEGEYVLTCWRKV